MSSETGKTGEVSNKAFHLALELLREQDIDPQELMADLPFTLHTIEHPKGRVHWEDFARFQERFEQRMGDPGIYDTCTERFMRRSEYSVYRKAVALLISPFHALELMCQWQGPDMFSIIQPELVRLDRQRARLTLRIPESYSDCPPFFRFTQHGLDTTMQILGGRPGGVTLDLQPRQGVYDITLPPSLTLWARFQRKLSRFWFNPTPDTLTREQAELDSMVEALRESEERYRQLVEQSSAFIWRFDPFQRRLTFASSSAKELTGYTPEEIEQISLEDLVLTADQPLMNAKLADLLAGRMPSDAVVQELRQVRKDGATLWCEIHATAIRHPSGEIVALQGVTHDITARKEVERERERAQAAESERDQLMAEVRQRRRVEAELSVARDRAEEAHRLKNSILASMSHEIRTPLTGLLGFSELLLHDLGGTPHEKRLQIIHRSGQRLLTLLNNMLDLARMEADNLPVEQRSYPIGVIVQHVVELLSLEAKHKGLKLAVSVPLDLTVYSDPRGDEQILLNVIGNAIRYTEQGSITVEARVAAQAGDAADVVELQVRDTGIGIDAAFLPFVFKEFRQESEGISRRFGGSGLGLAITRRMLESIGGSIAIDSRKGRGTTVKLRFPRKDVEVPDKNAINDETKQEGCQPEQPMPEDRRPTILVVEDDADCLALVEALLSQSYEILSATGSDEGLALARSHDIDCALLDINLVGSPMDGYGLLTRLRAIPGGTCLPVASMSAYTVDFFSSDTGIAFDKDFRKPLPLADILRWVQLACEGRPETKERSGQKNPA